MSPKSLIYKYPFLNVDHMLLAFNRDYWKWPLHKWPSEVGRCCKLIPWGSLAFPFSTDWLKATFSLFPQELPSALYRLLVPCRWTTISPSLLALFSLASLVSKPVCSRTVTEQPSKHTVLLVSCKQTLQLMMGHIIPSVALGKLWASSTPLGGPPFWCYPYHRITYHILSLNPILYLCIWICTTYSLPGPDTMFLHTVETTSCCPDPPVYSTQWQHPFWFH